MWMSPEVHFYGDEFRDSRQARVQDNTDMWAIIGLQMCQVGLCPGTNTSAMWTIAIVQLRHYQILMTVPSTQVQNLICTGKPKVKANATYSDYTPDSGREEVLHYKPI